MTLTDRQRALVFLDSFEKLEYRRKIEIIKLFTSPAELFSGGNVIRRTFEDRRDYNSVAAIPQTR